MSLNVNNYSQKLNELQVLLDRFPKIGDKLLVEDCNKLRSVIDELRTNADELLSENNILRIGVVGQVKAGKSSFLNSLLFNGENVLPRAATPMTAGLTVIEYGEENQFEVEFFNINEWRMFEDRAQEYDSIIEANRAADPSLTTDEIEKLCNISDELKSAKEMVESAGAAKSKISDSSRKETERFKDIEEMQEILKDYVGASGRYTAVVKCLTIRLHEDRLKDIQVVDTPGVNDPVVSREERTRQFLSGCHGVFFLSYSGRFFDSTDVNFLVNRIGSQGIGTIVVIASKFDSVLQDSGDKYDDDLAGACEYCEKALKKQMIYNIQHSDFRGNIPVLDFSSGIGYSISHKDESRWDSTESHVVKQMKRFYPSFFSTPSEIKDTFNDLSRIDDIRGKYLDQTFKSNKDKIIAEKVGGFISGMQRQLSEQITRRIDKTEKLLKNLLDGNLNDIDAQKKGFETVIKKLRNNLNRYIVNSQNGIANSVVSIKNDCYIDDVTFSTRRDSRTINRESTVLGRTKTVVVTYQNIDIQEIYTKGKQSLNKTVDELQRKWEKTVDSAKNNLFNEINNILTECEINDSECSIDMDIIRDFVNDALSRVEAYRKIDVTNLKSQSQVLEDQLQGVAELKSYVGECSENEAIDKYAEMAKKRIAEVRSILNQWRNNLNQEVKSIVDRRRKDIDNILAMEQNKLLNYIQEKTDIYIAQIQKSVENINRTQAEYESVLNKLVELKSVL